VSRSSTQQCIIGRAVLVVVAAMMAATAVAKAQSETTATPSVVRPPEPNFDQPVDYIAWYAKSRYEASWPRGDDVYSMLWSSEAAERVVAPEPAIGEQLQIAARQSWNPSARPELATYLAGLEKDIAAFIEAADTKHVRWHQGSTAAEWLLDETRRENASTKPVWQTLIPAVMASGWRMSADGKPDIDRLLAAWRAGLRYARHVQTSGGAVAYMTNGAVRSMVYIGIRNGLTQGLFDAGQLERIRQLLAAEDGAASLTDAYLFEWMGLLDVLQRIYPTQQFSKTAALELDQTAIAGLDQAAFPEALDSALGVDTYFEPFVRVAMQPWSLMSVQAADAAARAKRATAGNNPVLAYYLPPMAMVYDFGIRLETERRAILLLLAVYEKKLATGSWPISLESLSGGELIAARTDPLTFPPRDFGYRVFKGEAKLYTAGFDGDDNKGEHDRQWSRGKTGKDFVFFPSQQLAE
jgi:hypothetical protein